MKPFRETSFLYLCLIAYLGLQSSTRIDLNAARKRIGTVSLLQPMVYIVLSNNCFKITTSVKHK
jgi:hypothetical protein